MARVCVQLSGDEIYAPSGSPSGSDSGGDSSSSSNDTSCEAGSESEEDMVQTGSHRRQERTVRTIEAKSTQWQVVRQPAFQNWARTTMFTGQPQPLPDSLCGASDCRPSPELLLAPEEMLLRSQSHDVAPPTSPHSHSPTHSSLWTRTPDGDVQTFLRWQDNHGRVSRAPARRHASTVVETVALSDAVKMRAGEQLMPLYVDSFLKRQTLRAAPSEASSQVIGVQTESNRKAVTAEANRFDLRYGNAQDAIQHRLCFRPPKRSNTVSLGDVDRVIRGYGNSP